MSNEAGPMDRNAAFSLTTAIAAAFLIVAIVFAAQAPSWYFVFKSIHVLFAVIWVGGGALLTVLALVAQQRNDPDELAAIARQASMIGEKVFTPASIIVLVMGIAMMINGSLDWGQFWVTFGLLGFASTFVVGIGFLAPRSRKIVHLIETQGTAAAETQAAIAQLLVIARFDIAVLALVVLDMVLKPFS
jgi:uncharacterized membrane protein